MTIDWESVALPDEVEEALLALIRHGAPWQHARLPIEALRAAIARALAAERQLGRADSQAAPSFAERQPADMLRELRRQPRDVAMKLLTKWLDEAAEAGRLDGLNEGLRRAAPSIPVEELERALAAAREDAERLREALRLARDAMNHMGDALNDLDACEPEDAEKTAPAFAAVRLALGEPLERDAEILATFRARRDPAPAPSTETKP